MSAFLTKRIPAGAGLGGGSSDAASTLIALAQMWKLDWTASRLSDFAKNFGSDIPFFFHGPSSICTGRGEQVRPIDPPAAEFAVLVLPNIAMPTPQVYQRFDAMKLGRTQDLTDEPDWSDWTKLPAMKLLPKLVNDLEAPAFALRPELGELRAKLERELGRTVRMSGSGSSLFTLCDEEKEADDLASRARETSSADAIAVRLAPALNMISASAAKTI